MTGHGLRGVADLREARWRRDLHFRATWRCRAVCVGGSGSGANPRGRAYLLAGGLALEQLQNWCGVVWSAC